MRHLFFCSMKWMLSLSHRYLLQLDSLPFDPTGLVQFTVQSNLSSLLLTQHLINLIKNSDLHLWWNPSLSPADSRVSSSEGILIDFGGVWEHCHGKTRAIRMEARIAHELKKPVINGSRIPECLDDHSRE